jgi:hypothetical protein
VAIQDNLRLLEQKEIYVIGDKLNALQQVTEALAHEDGNFDQRHVLVSDVPGPEFYAGQRYT